MDGEAGHTSWHPTDEQLIAFADGESDGETDRPTAEHIESCAGCARTVVRYRQVREVLRDSGDEPSLAALARAKSLFVSAANPARRTPAHRLEPLRRIVARLVFDSGAGLSPAVAGLRGSGDRHLTYVAETVQVDLRLQPPATQDGSWRVQGQIDADERSPMTAIDMIPVGGTTAVARTTTDEHGMFALTAPSGRYDMLVRLPHALQVLPGLELG